MAAFRVLLLCLFLSVGCSEKIISPATSPKTATTTSTTSIGDWSSVVDRVEDSIYALVIFAWIGNTDYFIFAGTGFSAGTDVIVTNGHVIDWLYSVSDDLPSSWSYGWLAVQNITSTIDEGEIFSIESTAVHSDWNGDITSPDIGLVWIWTGEEHIRKSLDVASSSQARAIRVGDPIGTMGFPDELQDPDDKVQNIIPIATFKNGTISALRPPEKWNTFFRIPEDTYIVQHSFDTTSGTSGSPIFDQRGRVVAINNASFEWTPRDEHLGVGLGSLGFGIRADKIQELLRDYRIAAKPVVSRNQEAAKNRLAERDISSIPMITVKKFLAEHLNRQ